MIALLFLSGMFGIEGGAVWAFPEPFVLGICGVVNVALSIGLAAE